MPDSQTKRAAEGIPGRVSSVTYPPSAAAAGSRSPVLSAEGSPLSTTYAPEMLTRGMLRASLWLILVLVGSYTFLDYWSYSADFHLRPATYDLFLKGEGTAPAQYRIGLIYAAKVLHSAVHLGYRHSFAIFDFIFGIAAAYLLRSVLAGSRSFRAATLASRWMRLSVMLGLLSFYLSWSLWYQRPETLACALFVACSLFLLSMVRSQPLLIGGLFILSVAQGFIRADVAILFHFGLFLYVLLRGSKDFFASRTTLLLTSLVCFVVPAAELWVLMHKVFPHATYGETKVFQLLYNFSPSQVIPFLLFMVPTIYTYRRALARFGWLEGPQAALLLSAFFYLGSWAVVGRLQEVRIFVPFAMALIPLAANLVGEELALASD